MKVMIHGKERDIYMTTLQVFYTEWRKEMMIRYAVMGHAEGGLVDEIMSFSTVEKAIDLQKDIEKQLALEFEEEEFQTPFKPSKPLSFEEMLSDLPFPEVTNG